MKKITLVLMVSTVAMMATGCVGLKANNLPKVDMRSTLVDLPERKSVFLDFKPARGEDSNVVRYDAELHQSVFREVIINSRCCELAGSKEQADYVFEGAVKRITSPYKVPVTFLSAGSLSLIPTWMTNTYEVDMLVRAPSGRTTRIRKNDSVTHYNWLPLLPIGILPPVLINTHTADDRIFGNLYTNVMLDVKRSGILQGR